MIGGHRDSYRAQVLSVDTATDGCLTVKVFAVDNGFTRNVSSTCLYVLPEHLMGFPAQVSYNLLLTDGKGHTGKQTQICLMIKQLET